MTQQEDGVPEKPNIPCLWYYKTSEKQIYLYKKDKRK